MKIDLKKIVKESYDNVDLLLCGGAQGHMSHLFEDPDLTFKQLKDIFTKLFRGQIGIQEKCLAPSTTVQLQKNGIKTIQDVVDNKIEDNILTYNFELQQPCYYPIAGWTKNDDVDEWLKITLEDGTELTCTPNHRIYSNTAQHDVKAEQLHVGDSVIVVEKTN